MLRREQVKRHSVHETVHGDQPHFSAIECSVDFQGAFWSEWQDLNLRPPRPERGALPRAL